MQITNFIPVVIGVFSAFVAMSKDEKDVQIEKLNSELDEKSETLDKLISNYNELINKITSGSLTEDDLDDVGIPEEEEAEDDCEDDTYTHNIISNVTSNDDIPELGFYPSKVIDLGSDASSSILEFKDEIDEDSVLMEYLTNAYNHCGMLCTAYQLIAFEDIEYYKQKLLDDINEIRSVKLSGNVNKEAKKIRTRVIHDLTVYMSQINQLHVSVEDDEDSMVVPVQHKEPVEKEA